MTEGMKMVQFAFIGALALAVSAVMVACFGILDVQCIGNEDVKPQRSARPSRMRSTTVAAKSADLGGASFSLRSAGGSSVPSLRAAPTLAG